MAKQGTSRRNGHGLFLCGCRALAFLLFRHRGERPGGVLLVVELLAGPLARLFLWDELFYSLISLLRVLFLAAEPRIGPGLCLLPSHADDRDEEMSKLIPEDEKAM